MSIISNHKSMEDRINRHRIHKGLRILWPDYQIYDLLAQNMTTPEILGLAFFPPSIVEVSNGESTENVQELLKDYTHIAVSRKLHIDRSLQISKNYLIFLTKRNLALDSVSTKYTRGKYCLTVQVAQLNRQFSFWGAQVLAESLRTVGPKFITKRKTMWILEYEFEQSVKTLTLYSTRRQPSYGKSQNYFDLPRDALKQFCLNFRTYTSVIEHYLKAEGEQKLQSFTGFGPRLLTKSLIHHQKPFQKEDDKAQTQTIGDLMQLKCKVSEAGKPERQPARKLIKIKQVNSHNQESLAIDYDFLEVFESELASFKQANTNLMKQGDRPAFDKAQNQLKNSLSQIDAYKQLPFLQKLEFLQKLKDENLVHHQQYIINELVLEFGYLSVNKKFGEIKITVWLRIYYLINSLREQSFYELKRSIMHQILIIESGKLLKDSQDSIEQLQKLLGSNLQDCLLKCLEYHQQNQLFSTDILFILMKFEQLQNIIQLYKKYLIIHSSLYLAGSFEQYISQIGLPCNHQLDLLYDLKCKISKIEKVQTRRQEVKEEKMCQSLLDYRRYYVCIQKFQQRSLLVSRMFTASSKKFKIFIFKQDSNIFCFIQFLGYKNMTKNRNIVFHSFNMMFELSLNKKKQRRFLGWNFSLPSHAVGCSFSAEEQQISCLECTIYMKPEIVHQVIVNYMAIRYVQLFKFPCEAAEIQSRDNLENQRLSKRRSTFQLENLAMETNMDNLAEDCFFHQKCKQCENLLLGESIFQIDQTDMFSVFLSTPFKKETHFLMSMLKYAFLKNERKTNLDFLLSCLRTSYVSVSDLLKLYGEVQACLRGLVQYKLKMTINRGSGHSSMEKYFFAGKGRSLEQMRKFLEFQYSKQLIEHMMARK